MNGIECGIINKDAATVSQGNGILFYVINEAAGTITDAHGAIFNVANEGVGTITNGYGFRVATAANTGGGTFTNNYGLKVDDQTEATNNWAIKTGLGKVELGDNVIMTGAISTGLSSNIDLFLNNQRTVTFITGIQTILSSVKVESPIYAFAGASTIVIAASQFISSISQAGANATIVNNTELYLRSNVDSAASDTSNILITPISLTDSIGSVRVTGINIDDPFSGSVDLGTGNTPTLLSSIHLGAISFTAGGATTANVAATQYIAGAPIASTNVSFTEKYALYVFQDSVRFGGRILGSLATIAAANDFNPGDTNVVIVTGATQINAIVTTGVTAGTVFTLIFTSTPLVKHNTAGGAGTSKLFLAESGDFQASANDVLGVVFDGTQLQETFRKIA